MSKKSKRWQRLQAKQGSRTSGEEGNRRGRHNEDRVEAVLKKLHAAPWPPWIVSTRKATESEDHRGIDFVVAVDLGVVYLQVKSSKVAAEDFLKKGVVKELPIAVVVVVDDASSEGLRAQVLHRLTVLREELQLGCSGDWRSQRRLIAVIDNALKTAINKHGSITKDMTRTIAGEVAPHLDAWASGILGVPLERKLPGCNKGS